MEKLLPIVPNCKALVIGGDKGIGEEVKALMEVVKDWNNAPRGTKAWLVEFINTPCEGYYHESQLMRIDGGDFSKENQVNRELVYER